MTEQNKHSVEYFRLKEREENKRSGIDLKSDQEKDLYTYTDCRYVQTTLFNLWDDMLRFKATYVSARISWGEEEVDVSLEHAKECREFQDKTKDFSCRVLYEMIRAHKSFPFLEESK